MFDYRVVCVYPIPHETEGLENLDPLIVDELERSIAGSIEDGWEFVFTTSIRDSRPVNDPTSKRARTFVYRKCRVDAEIANGTQRARVSSTFGNVSEVNSPANVEAIDHVKPPEPPMNAKSLLTLAILNAVLNHKEIEPETILGDLKNKGEISAQEERVLAIYLREDMTPETLATMAPTDMHKDLFRVSVMPFSSEDEAYVNYLTELAFHLGLDEGFVASTIQAKRVQLAS